MSDLVSKRCLPCEGGVSALSPQRIETLMAQLNQWQLSDTHSEIKKVFQFKNYYQTLAFVNALAFIAHSENHHPDLEVSYNQCTVRYSTHAIGGLTENDFICAAKVDALLKKDPS